VTKSAGRGESTTEGFFFCASNGARRHARRGRNASHVTEIPIADLICNAPRTASHTRLRVSPASRKGERRSASFTSGVIRFPRVSVTTFTSYSRSARRHSRFPRSERFEHFSTRRECFQGRRALARARPFEPRATRLRAPVRAAAGGTPGSRRTAREPATSGGGGVTASASAHFRLLARIGDPGDPPSHPGARSWRRSAGHKLGALVSVSRARPLGLKCRPPTLT
jgi:hypothetical protein